MRELILITGGARSGKSDRSLEIAKKYNKVLFVATAIAFDDSMKRRIELHKNQRPSDWGLLERYDGFIDFKEEFTKYDLVIVDCLTIMITNIIFKQKINFDKITDKEYFNLELKIKKELKALLDSLENTNAIIVSNELGMGLVPDNYLSSVFRDIAGRANQMISKAATRAEFVVSGNVIITKGN